MDNQEPTLDELLNEPIIRLVMARDGVRSADVRATMALARRRALTARAVAAEDWSAAYVSAGRCAARFEQICAHRPAP
ncbi:MAG: hypothetical protein ACREIP_10925 [Alphaproteobacteria bacterium]